MSFQEQEVIDMGPAAPLGRDERIEGGWSTSPAPAGEYVQAYCDQVNNSFNLICVYLKVRVLLLFELNSLNNII